MRIYKRPGSPHWQVALGRKTRVSTGTADYKQAQEFARTLQERVWRRDKLGDRGTKTFREVTGRYLKGSSKPRVAERCHIRWLLETAGIGEDPISEVADADVFEEIREIADDEGWANSTVDRHMSTLRAILHYAKKSRMIDDVPSMPMYGGKRPDPRFLTHDQFAALCAELPAHLSLAAQFAVCTLLRHGSQTQLTWDRVDLDKGTIRVPGLHMKAGEAHGVALSPEAAEILRRARETPPHPNAVYHYDPTRCFGQRYFNTATFKAAAKRAGLPKLRWHDLRHTGASWAVQSGVTLLELMALGAWKSYSSVLIYAHLAPGNTAAAANAVGTNVAQALRSTPRKKP